MIIGKLDTEARVVLVAEIGNNHEGSFSVAKEMITAAGDSGVDAVKFQTFRTEDYVSGADTERFDRLKSFELTIDEFAELSVHARELGLAYLSTPLDLRSVEGLIPHVDAFKVSSGDNDFVPLLRSVCATEKPLVVSTGLTDLELCKRIAELVHREWESHGHQGELALLHCVSAYPTPMEFANIRAVSSMHSIPGCEIGYSDHTIGITACLGAVALGARIIEKHFTLDKEYSSFRDHQISADPTEMRELVRAIRDMEEVLGDGRKNVAPCESEAANLIRRSIVAARDLPRGHRLELDDLSWLRPREGLLPGQEDLLIGNCTIRAVERGEPFTVEMIQSSSMAHGSDC